MSAVDESFAIKAFAIDSAPQANMSWWPPWMIELRAKVVKADRRYYIRRIARARKLRRGWR